MRLKRLFREFSELEGPGTAGPVASRLPRPLEVGDLVDCETEYERFNRVRVERLIADVSQESGWPAGPGFEGTEVGSYGVPGDTHVFPESAVDPASLEKYTFAEGKTIRTTMGTLKRVIREALAHPAQRVVLCDVGSGEYWESSTLARVGPLTMPTDSQMLQWAEQFREEVDEDFSPGEFLGVSERPDLGMGQGVFVYADDPSWASRERRADEDMWTRTKYGNKASRPDRAFGGLEMQIDSSLGPNKQFR